MLAKAISNTKSHRPQQCLPCASKRSLIKNEINSASKQLYPLLRAGNWLLAKPFIVGISSGVFPRPHRGYFHADTSCTARLALHSVARQLPHLSNRGRVTNNISTPLSFSVLYMDASVKQLKRKQIYIFKIKNKLFFPKNDDNRYSTNCNYCLKN